ncbi:MAG: GNAT family N-acetyltransferase [Taibaiella sp.]|nr:GNAT family N-acetyltransferase [Taibaiella sp.]
MGGNITIQEVVYQSPDYYKVWQVREDVLRIPIGLSLKDEDLSDDAEDITLAVKDGEEVIGCVMLKPKDSSTIKLRQMAIVPSWQGKGIGRQLISEAERIASAKGFGKIILHARITAVNFYSKEAYMITGKQFTEVGIPHIAMYKTL